MRYRVEPAGGDDLAILESTEDVVHVGGLRRPGQPAAAITARDAALTLALPCTTTVRSARRAPRATSITVTPVTAVVTALVAPGWAVGGGARAGHRR